MREPLPRAMPRAIAPATITEWIRSHPELTVFDKVVTQSSDAEFHCLAITLFYRVRST